MLFDKPHAKQLPSMTAGIDSGVSYAEAVVHPGQKKGPPFVYAWSAVIKTLYKQTKTPALKTALLQYMQNFNDPRKMRRIVRHCTVHAQKNQKWATFTINIHHSLEPLWDLIRCELFAAGAEEFDSPTPPRGPIVRQMHDMISAAETHY